MKAISKQFEKMGKALGYYRLHEEEGKPAATVGHGKMITIGEPHVSVKNKTSKK